MKSNAKVQGIKAIPMKLVTRSVAKIAWSNSKPKFSRPCP